MSTTKIALTILGALLKGAITLGVFFGLVSAAIYGTGAFICHLTGKTPSGTLIGAVKVGLIVAAIIYAYNLLTNIGAIISAVQGVRKVSAAQRALQALNNFEKTHVKKEPV